MRTTIVIENSLESKLKGLASRKGLSAFVNECLREHFSRKERMRRLKALERSYARAARGKAVARDFEAIDRENWPEW